MPQTRSTPRDARLAWCEGVLHAAARLCDSPMAAMGVFTSTGERIVAGLGVPTSLNPARSAMTDAIPDHEDVLIAENLSAERVEADVLKASGARSCLAAAMLTPEAGRLGCIVCLDPRPRAFTDQQVADLATLASTAGVRWWAERERRDFDREDLRASAAMLEKLTTCVPGVLYQFRMTADGHTCFPYCNDGFRDVFALEPETVRTDATPAWERLHPDDIIRVRASVQASADHLTPWKDR